MATLTISKDEEKRVKALGFLSNKGTDNFSARIITVNGKITAEQQRVIAEAAEKFGNGNITFTTKCRAFPLTRSRNSAHISQRRDLRPEERVLLCAR